MDLRVFNRGDLIIEKTLNSHGLIVKTDLKSITIKWFKTSKMKRIVGLNEVVHLKTFVRKQIMMGNFIHQERKEKNEEVDDSSAS